MDHGVSKSRKTKVDYYSCPICGIASREQIDTCECGYRYTGKKYKFPLWRSLIIVASIIATIILLYLVLPETARENAITTLISTNPMTTQATTTSTTTIPTTTRAATTALQTLYKPVLVYNGQILLGDSESGECPLTVTVRGINNYYIYLDYVGLPGLPLINNNNSYYDFSFYVRAGSSVDVSVPIGMYKLYYAVGDTWYGTTYIFGNKTVWYTTDDIFTFYTDALFAHGHTLELYPQFGGNLETYEVEESDLPFMK